jgi:flagellar protein FlgJ
MNTGLITPFLDDQRFIPLSSFRKTGREGAWGSPAVPQAPGENFSSVLERISSQAKRGEEESPAPETGEKPKDGKFLIDKADKLYEQCQALESFLIKNLLTSMRNTVQKSEFLDGGFAGEIYEDMLYDEYAKDFTQNARLGLAELAYLELKGQRGKLMTERW